MKFGHNFQRALENDMPQDWQSAAIQYKALKKCIKRFVCELSSLGLSMETIRDIIVSNATPAGQGKVQPITLEYSLAGRKGNISPRLIVRIDLDAVKSDERAKAVMKQLCVSRRDPSFQTKTTGGKPVAEVMEDEHCKCCEHSDNEEQNANLQTMELALSEDREFFSSLMAELRNVENLQEQQRVSLFNEIEKLSKQISKVTSPLHHSTNHSLYRWRKIFQLYIEADIFMSSKECEKHAIRSPELAAQHLRWFDEQVCRSKCLPASSKHRDVVLYKEFISLNMRLLQATSFQTMNKLAVTKILKKFDKRTCLTAQPLFFKCVASDPFLMADNVGKAICFTLSNSLLSIVPQLQDFECPVCASIAYKPVRLKCSHVFCLHCLIILQRQKNRFCPLCRAEDVMKANSLNVDHALTNFMETYFPKEIKEKMQDNEDEELGIVRVVADTNACTIM
ncbi:ubiquitin-protein ligase E3 [Schizosaccharomyces japonicus yFS275]|uniref:Ubiquitin-protein ligase E3 n=1 Tax=Schizosaccharomyces japonicus (strain yFS275 / FY16936) TaxID=402676 RepID=B6K8B3_SCHJY|nr:ubiquitin-protein ligase E3 [Schizosaccharomyces japonicus yFS275]EEB09767.1 ubiquitin-protein ligase E3 [Schizosaccharomyces japonicus yFS275]